MNKRVAEKLSNFIIIAVIMIIAVISVQGSASHVFRQDSYQPIYRGNTASNNISLMINVYWGTEYIEDILDVLDSYNAKVTFFIGGTWAASNTELVGKMINRGHEIGNHGYFHKTQSKLTYQQNFDEINNNHKVVMTNHTYNMKLFAPPSGDFSTNTLKSAYDLGYKTIMWSRDTIDWRDKDSNVVLSRATKNTSNGELILMHPTEHTLKALPQILRYYRDNKYIVTTVSDNINGVNNYANTQNFPKRLETGSQTHARYVYGQLWSIC